MYDFQQAESNLNNQIFMCNLDCWLSELEYLSFVAIVVHATDHYWVLK